MKMRFNNHRNLLTGALFAVLALITAGCGQGLVQPEEIVAVPPTATHTPTPFPSATPTNTPTPLPTAAPTDTPTPPATPLPQVVLAVSGPEIIPAGLPRAAEWRIQVEAGAELVIVSIDDLGGVMLTGDTEDRLDLVKSLVPFSAPNVALTYDNQWVISGIIDPNIGRGVLSLLIETAGYQETVTLPWVSSNVEEIQYRTYQIAMDGIDQEPEIDADATTEVSRPGFNRYTTTRGLGFDYPQAWFVNEFQDGTIQLSTDPLAVADGATPADVPYASIIAGDRELVGIPLDIQLDPEAIIDWLLGDVVATGGEQAGLYLSDELEVVQRRPLDLGDGSVTTEVVLKPVDSGGEAGAEARFIVSVKGDDRLFVLTGFDPDGSFFDQLLPVVESFEFN